MDVSKIVESPHIFRIFDILAFLYFAIYLGVALYRKRVPLGRITRGRPISIDRATVPRAYWAAIAVVCLVVLWTGVAGALG